MRALTHTEEDTLYAKALKELKYGDPTVSKEERHKLYRKLCKEFHPDLNPEMLKKDPNSEIIKQINIAYEDIKKGTVRHIEQVKETLNNQREERILPKQRPVNIAIRIGNKNIATQSI